MGEVHEGKWAPVKTFGPSAEYPSYKLRKRAELAALDQQANSVPPKGQASFGLDGNTPRLTEDQVWLRDRCPETK